MCLLLKPLEWLAKLVSGLSERVTFLLAFLLNGVALFELSKQFFMLLILAMEKKICFVFGSSSLTSINYGYVRHSSCCASQFFV